MIKLSQILLILVLVTSIQTLQIGECVQRHSDGWTCLKCRDNYHLFQGKCYINILGCTEYHQGNICKECDRNYMLVNNLCCDPICLSKIFSTHKQAINKKMFSSNALILNNILPLIQNGPLTGSTYRLQAVQSKKYINITRYFFLYQIISSYSSEYISKRAVVDYNEVTKKSTIVDWSSVSYETEYTVVGKQDLKSTTFQSILSSFQDLYINIDSSLENYKISLGNLTNVKQYSVLYYDHSQNTVNLKIFYSHEGSTVLLVDQYDEINIFKPYKKTYPTLAEIKVASVNNTLLKNSLSFVTSLPVLNNAQILVAVEWANEPKLIVFRYYAENATHTFELVIDYITTPITKFTLSYQSACRQNVKFNSCSGEVYWNGKMIQNITPSDYNIHNSTTSVSIQSENTLIFKGTGISDRYGLTIDNVNLHKLGSSQNLLINGDFQIPNLAKGWRIMKNPNGWLGDQIEIGFGQLYNKNWKTQVCELDSHNNSQLTQKVTIDLEQGTSYSLISTTINKKKPPTPVSLVIPTSKDTVEQINGQISEVIEYSASNQFIKTLLLQTNTYLISFQKSVPTSKLVEYHFVLTLFKTIPINIALVKNCKYTEIAFLFQSDQKTYTFIYFIQQIKSKSLSYLGMSNSTNKDDPSFAKNTETYSADQFTKMIGYKPTFTPVNVQNISIRKNSVFKRKSLKVITNKKTIFNYYMYYKLNNSNQQKLYSCACKGTSGSHKSQSWTDILGQQGKKSNKIQEIMGQDVAIQINNFLKISTPQTTNWKMIEVQMNQYELKIQYVITYTLNNNYLMVVVAHDKKDHSNALIISEELTQKEFKQFNRTQSSYLIEPTRLPSQKITNKIINNLFDNNQFDFQNYTLIGIIRSNQSPNSEKNIIIIKDNVQQYWVIITICNILGKQLNPTLQQIKIIDFSIVQLLLDAAKGQDGPSADTIQQSNQIQSFTSGVIYDGQAFQIQKNIKEEKLTSDMKEIIQFIKDQIKVTNISGNLLHIEQHSDGVVIEFAISYQQPKINNQNSYTRYFVIKPINKTLPLFFMGDDTTKKNPQENMYFSPTPQLDKKKNIDQFDSIAKSINELQKKTFTTDSINSLWVSYYPKGQYSISYLNKNNIQAAAYIIKSSQKISIIKYMESIEGKIENKVPIIEVNMNIENENKENILINCIQLQKNNITEQLNGKRQQNHGKQDIRENIEKNNQEKDKKDEKEKDKKDEKEKDKKDEKEKDKKDEKEKDKKDEKEKDKKDEKEIKVEKADQEKDKKDEKEKDKKDEKEKDKKDEKEIKVEKADQEKDKKDEKEKDKKDEKEKDKKDEKEKDKKDEKEIKVEKADQEKDKKDEKEKDKKDEKEKDKKDEKEKDKKDEKEKDNKDEKEKDKKDEKEKDKKDEKEKDKKDEKEIKVEKADQEKDKKDEKEKDKKDEKEKDKKDEKEKDKKDEKEIKVEKADQEKDKKDEKEKDKKDEKEKDKKDEKEIKVEKADQEKDKKDEKEKDKKDEKEKDNKDEKEKDKKDEKEKDKKDEKEIKFEKADQENEKKDEKEKENQRQKSQTTTPSTDQGKPTTSTQGQTTPTTDSGKPTTSTQGQTIPTTDSGKPTTSTQGQTTPTTDSGKPTTSTQGQTTPTTDSGKPTTSTQGQTTPTTDSGKPTTSTQGQTTPTTDSGKPTTSTQGQTIPTTSTQGQTTPTTDSGKPTTSTQGQTIPTTSTQGQTSPTTDSGKPTTSTQGQTIPTTSTQGQTTPTTDSGKPTTSTQGQTTPTTDSGKPTTSTQGQTTPTTDSGKPTTSTQGQTIPTTSTQGQTTPTTDSGKPTTSTQGQTTPTTDSGKPTTSTQGQTTPTTDSGKPTTSTQGQTTPTTDSGKPTTSIQGQTTPTTDSGKPTTSTQGQTTPTTDSGKPTTSTQGQTTPTTDSGKPTTSTQGQTIPTTSTQGQTTPTTDSGKPTTSTQGQTIPTTSTQGQTIPTTDSGKPTTSTQGQTTPTTSTQGQTTPTTDSGKPTTSTQGQTTPTTSTQGQTTPTTDSGKPTTSTQGQTTPTTDSGKPTASTQGQKIPTTSTQGQTTPTTDSGKPTTSTQGQTTPTTDSGKPTTSTQGQTTPTTDSGKPTTSTQGQTTPTTSTQGQTTPTTDSGKPTTSTQGQTTPTTDSGKPTTSTQGQKIPTTSTQGQTTPTTDSGKPTTSTQGQTTPTTDSGKPTTSTQGQTIPTTSTQGQTTPTTDSGKPTTSTQGQTIPTTSTQGQTTPITDSGKPTTSTQGQTIPTTSTQGQTIPTTDSGKPTTSTQGQTTPTTDSGKPTTSTQGQTTPTTDSGKPTTSTQGQTTPTTDSGKPTTSTQGQTIPTTSTQGQTTPTTDSGKPTTSTQGQKIPTTSTQGQTIPTTDSGKPTTSTQGQTTPTTDTGKPTTSTQGQITLTTPKITQSLPSPFTQSIAFLRSLPQFQNCTLLSFTQVTFTSGANELFTLNCTILQIPSLCNASISFNYNTPPVLNYFDCSQIKPINPQKSSTTSTNLQLQISAPQPVYTPPTNPSIPTPNIQSTQNPDLSQIGQNVINRVENIDYQLIDPNQVYQFQALQKIQTTEVNDKSLVPITSVTNSIQEIIIYLRASYAILDNYEVLKITQDTSITGNTERYVIYFFIGPNEGSSYIVYRAIAEINNSQLQSKIFILAFDLFIQKNQLVNSPTVVEQIAAETKLDIDIAFGYQTIDQNTVNTDKNIKNVLAQINSKYQSLIHNSNLDKVESLQLKSGKINYKITYLNPTNHLSQKFIIFYDPVINKVMILNSISLPSAQQFQQLSETQKSNDSILTEILKYLNNIHKNETENYKIQCVSKGVQQSYTEYHITWSSNSKQYRSFVRSNNKNPTNLIEITFGQIQTISLDHYKLDQFEKMFILNYQMLSDYDVQTDPNFKLVLHSLFNKNSTLSTAALIGAAKKPLGLGFIYRIYFRLLSGQIDRIQIFVELSTNKLTLNQIVVQDFTSNLVNVNQNDNSTKKIIDLIVKQAAKPTIGTTYTVTSIQAKDFLFGRIFEVEISLDGSSYIAIVYHDHSSEQVQLLSWGLKNTISNCLDLNGTKCNKCVEGYSLINQVCVFGCGVLCKSIKI